MSQSQVYSNLNIYWSNTIFCMVSNLAISSSPCSSWMTTQAISAESRSNFLAWEKHNISMTLRLQKTVLICNWEKLGTSWGWAVPSSGQAYIFIRLILAQVALHPRWHLQCVAGHCYYQLCSSLSLSSSSFTSFVLTHFGETPEAENVFPPIFWHN